MQKYTKVKVLRITEEQHNTLVKMKKLNVDVSEFIRIAIKEKIQRDKSHLIKNKNKIEYCPFSNNTIILSES